MLARQSTDIADTPKFKMSDRNKRKKPVISDWLIRCYVQ